MSKDSKILLAAVVISTAIVIGFQMYLQVRFVRSLQVARTAVKATPRVTPVATEAVPSASASASPRVKASTRPSATPAATVAATPED